MPVSTAKVPNYSTMSAKQIGEITEEIAIIAIGGKLAPYNAKGYDLTSGQLGKVEIRARTLGTDGLWPRVTLNPSKMGIAHHTMAVRWTENGELAKAVLMPMAAVKELYSIRLQKRPQAHIAWKAWCNLSAAIDLTGEMKHATRIWFG